MAKSNWPYIYKLPYRTNYILTNHIIQCYPIGIILEKYIYSLYGY